MKKIYLYAIALLMSSVAFTSCNDDNDQLTDSRITYYVVLEMQGDDFVVVPKGSVYEDAGCKATLAGEDASSRLVVNNEVDVNTVGLYEVTYSAVNDDGFAISESRQVLVYDPEAKVDLSGEYTTDMEKSVYLNNGKTFADRAEYYGNTSSVDGIIFEEFLPGIFEVNEMFGGWYWQIRGYGEGYAMTAMVAVDDDGNLTLLDSLTPSWGDGLDYIEDATVDLETGTISYSLSYAEQIFMAIVLNKK